MTPQETSNCQPPCVGVIGSGDWLGSNVNNIINIWQQKS